jgi:hypothetical protein
MLITCILKPEDEREWVKFIRYGLSATGGLFSQQQALCTSILHKQMEIPGLAEWLTWRRVISLEPCWLLWSPVCTESLVPFPRICPWISNPIRGVRAVLAWTIRSIDYLVCVSLRSTGEPVGCDLNSVSALVSVPWNLVCPTGGRSAVGSCRELSYKWANEVFTYIACCLLLPIGLPENSFLFVTNVEGFCMAFDFYFCLNNVSCFWYWSYSSLFSGPLWRIITKGQLNSD